MERRICFSFGSFIQGQIVHGQCNQKIDERRFYLVHSSEGQKNMFNINQRIDIERLEIPTNATHLSVLKL
jgi:hypothetical protein